MSKKSKKQARKTSAPRPAEGAAPVVQSAPSTNGGPVMFSARGAEQAFRPDYSQTIKDLKRIGILAGTFIGVLIVLTFFLR